MFIIMKFNLLPPKKTNAIKGVEIKIFNFINRIFTFETLFNHSECSKFKKH